MKLLLDIGNSRVKWARFDNNGLQPMQAAVYPLSQFSEWCNQYLAQMPRPESVRVANVAGSDVAEALTRWCRQHWQLTPDYAVTARSAGNLRNGYDNVAEMGVDRWLAMLAARQLSHESICVISCGTAVTLDAVKADGRHLGGLILPGPALMQDVLNTSTQGARTHDVLELQLELGRSTRLGVAAGSAYAIAGMIERTLDQLEQAHGQQWHCLITGGAAASITPLCRVPMENIPDLVLQGLAL